MKRPFFLFGLFPLLLVISSCTSQNPSPGGTEFGNPTQTVNGSATPPLAPPGTTTILLAPCGADALTAINSQGQEQKVSLGADCHFSITLPTNQGYAFLFTAKDQFVARLVANPGDSFPRLSFFLSLAPSTIDLGPVQLQKDLALPTNSPLSQVDRDKDGLTDAVDPDDDNDGLPDVEEKDCDLDGFIDDDDASSSCPALGSSQPVLQVSPFSGQTGVESTEPIRVRLGCAVNMSLFTPMDFTVRPSGGSTFIPCSFTFPDAKTIECDHGSFTPNTAFEGTLSEIDCQDGSKTQTVTWSWTTAS
jgi:hypothetical protein